MLLGAAPACAAPSASGRNQHASVGPCRLRARPFLAGEAPLAHRQRATQQQSSRSLQLGVCAVAAPEKVFAGGKVVKASCCRCATAAAVAATATPRGSSVAGVCIELNIVLGNSTQQQSRMAHTACAVPTRKRVGKSCLPCLCDHPAGAP